MGTGHGGRLGRVNGYRSWEVRLMGTGHGAG